MHHHRIETPMPRSAQIRAAQLAGLASSPVAASPVADASMSPSFAPNAVPTPLATHRIRRNLSAANVAIDYGKYKTKLCRNFIMGVPCPFESRCVFSHGDRDSNEGSPATLSHENSVVFDRQPQSTTSAYTPTMDFPPMYETATPASSDDEPAVGSMPPPPPPSYQAFIMAAVEMSPRPRRHNPYDPCVFGYPYVAAY